MSRPSTQTVASRRSACAAAESRSSPPSAAAGRYAWCPSSLRTSSGSSSHRSPSRARANASGVSGPSRLTGAAPTVTTSGSGPSRCQLTTSTFPLASSGRSGDGTRSNAS